MHPPHLPPKSCRVDTHYQLQSLSKALLTVALASLAGVAAALATVAWVAPAVIFEQMIYTVDKNKQPVFTTPDPVLVHQTKQRLLTIYDKRKKTGRAYYSADTLVSQAVILSSDGWAVLSRPNYTMGEEKQWEAVDSQGIFYPIEEAVKDPVAGYLYLRVKAEGLRIMPFADWSDVALGAPLWVILDGRWQNVFVEEIRQLKSGEKVPVWHPLHRFALSVGQETNKVALNQKGELVGFTGAEQTLAPVWLVEIQLSNLLEKQLIRYQALPWTGYVVDGVVIENTLKKVPGFYVADSPTKVTSSTVGAGDVILRLDNRVIDPLNLSRDILSTPDSLRVTVWRNGKEVEVEVKKVGVGG